MKTKAPDNTYGQPSKTRKAATMQDVAHAAGVSKMTVSFVFNDTGRISPETRQVVMRAARELNFQPNPHAQRLSQGRSNKTIGLFVLDLNLGPGIRKATLIQSAFIERGYEVPLYGYSIYNYDEGGRRQIKLMKTLCRQRPRAIVCHTSALHPKAVDELRHYLDDGGTVALYDESVGIDCDRVLFDRAENTYQAVQHLVHLEHRQIGLAASTPPSGQTPRLDGYLRALREFDLTQREEWVFGDLRPYEEGGEQLAERFATMVDRPTALCIVNDSVAATFVLEAQRRGVRVPADVSVVSLDNMPAASYAAVPLTSVSQPIEDISDAVVELVMSRLECRYEGEPRQIVVRGELVGRQSTAPAPVSV